MYICIHHSISDPGAFWNTAEQLANLPPHLTLHHSFPTKDGSRAVCIWEADSIDTLRRFIEAKVGHASRNEYFEVENKEAVGMPSALQAARAPA